MTTAERLAVLLEQLIGAPLPVRLRTWDGSEAGPTTAGPTVVVAHRRALRRLLWNPGERGLARAFVAGELEVDGDLEQALSAFHALGRPGGVRLSTADRLQALRTAVRLGALGPRPRPPASEARLSGTSHSRRRDRDAIAHHYDLSNEFYKFLLDPQLAYSCGYWTRRDDPSYGLVQAQQDKLELICRKLALGPGSRLLDVGCGWGALAIHAARHHGAEVVGVTLSVQQQRFALDRVRALGLQDRVQIRLQDYREIPDGPFDAVSSIEMGEHVGRDNYPTYAGVLLHKLAPGGRLLLQQMSRGAAGADAHPGGGAFMETYVAPDMNMRPLGETIAMLERAGHEVVDVHGLREHYVWTLQPWQDQLTRNRARAVELVGPEQYRIWVLYLAGASLAFRENRMGVHQILTVRPHADGSTGLPPARPDVLGWPAADDRTGPGPTS